MSYQRLKKWYLIPPCLTLSDITYVSRESRVIQGNEWRPLLYLSVVAIEKGPFWSPTTTVANLLYTYTCTHAIII